MTQDPRNIEEHELPSVEAVLACTLALMTGYSQALQAEVHPAQRLSMGENVGRHLSILIDNPLLSAAFRRVLADLRARWRAMADCTRDAAADCAGPASTAHPGGPEGSAAPRRGPAPDYLH